MNNLMAQAMITAAFLALAATILSIEILRRRARQKADCLPVRLSLHEAVQCMQEGAMIIAGISISWRSLDFGLGPLSSDERVLLAIAGVVMVWTSVKSLWARVWMETAYR